MLHFIKTKYFCVSARPSSGINRKVKNCLKRIEKNEEKERKILQNKRKELTKGLEETEKLLEQRQKKLDKTTNVEERKIDDEIQKITNVKQIFTKLNLKVR